MKSYRTAGKPVAAQPALPPKEEVAERSSVPGETRAKPLPLAAVLEAQSMLPSQPRALALLASELLRPQPHMRSLSQLFSMDPVLAARLLAMANGPAHLMRQRVHSIPEALVVLSPMQLRQLLHKARPGVDRPSASGWQLASFWRYSLDTARLARALAMSVQCNASAAYALGLVHGLGELLLQQADPGTATRLAELLEPLHPRRPLVEMQLMGYCSAQICAHLAKQWSLPTVLAEALQYMHQPLQQPVFEPLTGVLHLAMWRAGTRALGWSERQLAVSFPAEVGLALGMDIDMVLRQASVDWHAGGEPDVIF